MICCIVFTFSWSNQSILKEITPWCSLEDWCWSWNPNTLATWCKKLIHLKRPWCWERLRAGEGDDRGWDGWMASLTKWTWVCINSRSWWWTGRYAVVHGVAKSQTQLRDWTDWKYFLIFHDLTPELFKSVFFFISKNFFTEV